MLKNILEAIKSFHLDNGLPTWTNPNGNIIQPRFYRTFNQYKDNYIGNTYPDDYGVKRFGAQLGRFVFTTEPK